MKKHALKKAKQSPFAGDDLTPTVFVYNEHGINGNKNIDNDGVGNDTNENANLLSIVKYLIDKGENYILNREIQSFRDPEDLKKKLDVFPSFFFMTDMEWQSNKDAKPAIKKANPNDLNWLPEGSKQVLRDYVDAGGTIVQTGTVYGWDVDFLNNIFDLNLVAVPDDTVVGNQPSNKTPNKTWARQSVLDSLALGEGMKVESIKVIEGVDTINASQIINAEYTSFYGPESDSLVGVISYGDGKIYYVGSDYRKSGYPTNWGFGSHEGEHKWNGEPFVQEVLPAILKQAAKEAKENFPFPYNYQDDDGDFEIDECKPIKENSFELGSGKDVLINCCSLEVTGDGEIDLGAGKDRMETNMLISATKLDGGADRDELILIDLESCEEGFDVKDDLTVRSMKIVNFEDIKVDGGTWEFAGNFKKADIVISGGSLSVPVLKRRSSGLLAKSLKIEEQGAMEIDLSDPDVIADDLSGKWVVLRAKKGLGGLSADQMNEINVMRPDGYDYQVSLNPKETKLIVKLIEIV